MRYAFWCPRSFGRHVHRHQQPPPRIMRCDAPEIHAPQVACEFSQEVHSKVRDFAAPTAPPEKRHKITWIREIDKKLQKRKTACARPTRCPMVAANMTASQEGVEGRAMSRILEEAAIKCERHDSSGGKQSKRTTTNLSTTKTETMRAVRASLLPPHLRFSD